MITRDHEDLAETLVARPGFMLELVSSGAVEHLSEWRTPPEAAAVPDEHGPGDALAD